MRHSWIWLCRILQWWTGMIVFHVDLDNTLIYSYKHDIGARKRCVETYEGREISFVTERTYGLLEAIKDSVLIVPTSTRTKEQYERIDLGIGGMKYALVCNGGVLLVDGEVDRGWYERSLELAADSRGEMERALKILERDERRYFELRLIEQLFVFTKCRDHGDVAAELREELDGELADVLDNGDKVYVVPRNLNKGMAVKRFRERVGAGFLVAAGDSAFDVSMLCQADRALAPHGFGRKYGVGKEYGILEAEEGEVFSEFVLGKCWEMASRGSYAMPAYVPKNF